MQDLTNTNKSAGGLAGDFTMNESTGHRRYACSTEGDTEIRVVPSFAHGVPEPLIKSSEITSANLSDAFIRVGMVTFYGKNRLSLLEVPPPRGVRQGPLQFFYNYIVNEVKTKPRSCSSDWRRWQGLRDEGDIQAPKRIISPPSATLMCQGLLIQHKGQLCTDKNGNPTMKYPVVLSIKPSGAKTLLDNLLTPIDNNAPWSDDNNIFGNIVDLNRGKTLKVVPYETENNGMRQTWYKCEVGEEFPITQEQAMSVWRPWNEVLNLSMSIGDMMIKIADTFDARSVVQVFESEPAYAELIPNEVYEAKAREERIMLGTRTEPVETAPIQRPSWTPPVMPPAPTMVGGPARTAPSMPSGGVDNGLQLPMFQDPEENEDTSFTESTVLPKAGDDQLKDRLAALRNRVNQK